MLKRILRTSACVMFAIAVLSNLANADVLNQRDTINGTVTNIPENDGPGGANAFRTINITENELIQDLSITIEGLQHNFAGDLVAILRKVDPITNQSIAASNIFNRIQLAGNTEGDSSNFNGNYTFTSTGGPNSNSPANIWTTAAGLNTDQVIPGSNSGVGSSTIYSAVNANGAEVSLAQVFGGLSTAGEWEFLIRDESLNNQGTFTGVTLNFQTGVAAIPEPGSLGLIAMASLGFCMRRRRK